MPCTLRLELCEGEKTQLVAEEKREERQAKEIERNGKSWKYTGRLGRSIGEIKIERKTEKGR